MWDHMSPQKQKTKWGQTSLLGFSGPASFSSSLGLGEASYIGDAFFFFLFWTPVFLQLLGAPAFFNFPRASSMTREASMSHREELSFLIVFVDRVGGLELQPRQCLSLQTGSLKPFLFTLTLGLLLISLSTRINLFLFSFLFLFFPLSVSSSTGGASEVSISETSGSASVRVQVGAFFTGHLLGNEKAILLPSLIQERKAFDCRILGTPKMTWGQQQGSKEPCPVIRDQTLWNRFRNLGSQKFGPWANRAIKGVCLPRVRQWQGGSIVNKDSPHVDSMAQWYSLGLLLLLSAVEFHHHSLGPPLGFQGERHPP